MTPSQNKLVKKRIAIIGGGILGLTTAFYLSQQNENLEIDILEKSPDVGGLAGVNNLDNFTDGPADSRKSGSKDSPATSSPDGSSVRHEYWPYLEKYYHHFFASDSALKELLKDLGIHDKLKWHDAKMGLYINNQLIDFSTALDILKFKPLGFLNRIRLGMVSLFLQKWPFEGGFAKVSAIDWCNRYFGKTVTSIMWQPLLQSKFAGFSNQISMLWLHSRIKDRSSSRPGPFSAEKLGYIDGGLYTLINTLVKKLATKGVKIFTNVSIMGIESKNTTHHLKFQHKNQQIKKGYDIVIATIPPKDFIRNFAPPAKYSNELMQLKFLGAICITIILKKKFMPYYWLTINDPKEPFVAVIEHTNYISASHYRNKNILYLGKYLDPNDPFFTLEESKMQKIIEIFLHKINPKFNSSWIEFLSIQKSNSAQHIVNTGYQPTQPGTGKVGLYYAHFSQIYPHDRGINYAVAQGFYLSKLISTQWKS